MAKSSGTFNKRENEKKRIQKRKDKEQRREERKANKGDKSFEDMIAYVDENGNFSSTPPDNTKRKVIKEGDINLASRNFGNNATQNERRQGFIRTFHSDKGYGFIKDTSTQDEFFFHFTGADYQVAQSDAVTFEVQSGPKGLNAVRIEKVVPANTKNG